MHPAAGLQFERVVDEYVRWRAIAEAERPPAPAWWWGPALDVRGEGGWDYLTARPTWMRQECC